MLSCPIWCVVEDIHTYVAEDIHTCVAEDIHTPSNTKTQQNPAYAHMYASVDYHRSGRAAAEGPTSLRVHRIGPQL